jgi:CPA2 family monovalent cation:H+ antiporter-2
VDAANIQTWSEIGVIFLLFALGLEFSFRKLAKVGGTASVTAVVEAVGMLLLGYFTGRLMGWNTMDSLFLGGILSVSSTTIIIRAFEELGLKTQGFAVLVFGVLVVEDLVAILLMVLLSTVAVSQQFSGTELLFALGKLGFFLVIWFVGGILLIPTFLNKVRKLMNDEMLLVVAIALCLGMVYLAAQAGFSSALGAFIMGSLLAETVMAEKIEHQIKPVKDLFAAVFFVSVGMLIDPKALLEHWVPVLVISAVTIVGKLVTTSAGALLAGQPMKRSIQAGMSLAQIGEFSFIIATLGLSLGVTSGFLYPIAVAVSAVTTFTTPYMISLSGPFAERLIKLVPHRVMQALDRYSQQTERATVVSEWRVLLRAYMVNLILWGTCSLAVILLGSRVLERWFGDGIGWFDGRLLAGFATLVLLLPFIWAMSFRRIRADAYRHLWLNKRTLRGPLVALEVGRIAAAILVLTVLVARFFQTNVALFAALVFIGISAYIFRRRLQRFYQRVEQRFLLNLTQRETSRERPSLTPWDMHLAEVKLPAGSVAMGRSLQELALRERYGVNIALIERGDRTIPVPARDERLLPGDNLVLIGTDEQLVKVNNELATTLPENGTDELDKEDLRVRKYRIPPRSPLIGRTIRESGIREEGHALVTGIERGEQRIPNPESTVVLQQGDLLWLVGNSSRLQEFMADGKGMIE